MVTVDRDRLVDTASRKIGVHSFTGDEENMARLMVELYGELGLQTQWQQVQENRANALVLSITADPQDADRFRHRYGSKLKPEAA